MSDGNASSIGHIYEAYRGSGRDNFGLAWYLAAEICTRYYTSHGIAPCIIDQDGLGYYGIQFEQLPCKVAKSGRELGRVTMQGDVENWITGTRGDHGLKLVERASAGESRSSLLREAINHLGFSPKPSANHEGCRHRRYGMSYAMLFRLAASLSIRHEGRIQIWNHPFSFTYGPAGIPLPLPGEDAPGPFKFSVARSTLAVSSRGMVLNGTPEGSLWERYMHGETEDDLLRWFEETLGLVESARNP